MRHQTVTLSDEFDVVPQSESHNVKLIHPSELAAQLKASTTIQNLDYGSWHGGGIDGMFQITPVPVNIAFDIFARYGGQEYPIGQITAVRNSDIAYARCDQLRPG